MTVTYIPGEDNSVADALSRVRDGAFPGETTTTASHSVNATLCITTDPSILHDIQNGYQHDDFCKRLMEPTFNLKGVSSSNGLWYIGDWMIIPHVNNIREQLFHLAHDTSGHFSADKSYATLRDTYYWPNMCRDLEKAYIPSCTECLRNKSSTRKPLGPLHPLPIPDERGDSVAIDFIGPLPHDEGHDCILTMTDRLGSDVRIIPTVTTLTADNLALLFFEHWYCENGLPRDIISD